MGSASFYHQADYNIRFMWGRHGAARLGASCDVVVIVDVMSFTTSVVVALEQGATVFPYTWRDESARAFAEQKDAQLAGSRRAGGLSLSPVSLTSLGAGDRVVLPSPNGSTLSLATGDTPTLSGCLRNATATARAAMSLGTTIGVVAAGERWTENDSLRPAFEDLVGGGAILAVLCDERSKHVASPEAHAAIAAFNGASPRLLSSLQSCVGGRELTEMGFKKDIDLIAAHDVTHVVPILSDGAFVPK